MRCTAHVTLEIARDHGGDRPPPGPSLGRTASRLKRQEAATQAMIHDGLEHLHRGSRLGEQITAERDHLDGAPSASDIRRAAPRRAQLRSLGRAPQHDLRGGWVDVWIQPGVPVGWIENDGHPVVDGLGFIYGLA